MKNVKEPEEPSPNNTKRTIIIIVLVVLAIILAFSFARCSRIKKEKAEAARVEAVLKAAAAKKAAEPPPPPPPPTNEVGEIVSPATLEAPAQVVAGNVLPVKWVGPNNPKDYVTIVAKDAKDGTYGNYVDVHTGNPLQLTAPVEPGDYEIRYMTTKTKSVLGRVPLKVNPATATLEAVDTILLAAKLKVTWTGPNNPKDYITVVAVGTADGQYGNYTYTTEGSPLNLTMPPTAGDFELRYMTGQGGKVLARLPVKLIAPAITLSSEPQVVAGSNLSVTWAGPNNQGDYITVTGKATADGQYGNYTYTTKGSPMEILVPIMEGEAEIRYMSGQGNKVLGRAPVKVVAAKITLEAPREIRATYPISITWSGPNNPGDYITVVKGILPDGERSTYVLTSKGSPISINAATWPGDYEIRYMSGQGNKVLKKRPIRVTQ